MTRIEQAATAVSAARAMFADADSLARAPREEIEALLAGTAEISRILDAQRVRLAGEIAERSKGPDEQSICRVLGHRSPKEAVASAFGLHVRDAQALLRLAALTSPAVTLTGAQVASKYPRVADALDRGGLSLAQAQAIVQNLEPAAPRADLELLAGVEEALVDAATDPAFPLVPELLVIQARAYVAVLDPDGVLPDAERQRAMRSFRMWQQPSGIWKFDGCSPAEHGSELKALLDAYTGPRVKVAFRDDDPSTGPDAGVDRDADVDPGVGTDPAGARNVDANGQPSADGIAVVDDRTLEQKRHDVLFGVVRAHAASGDAPVAGGEPPTLVFTGTIDAYDAYLRGAEHPDRTLTIEHTGALVPIETVGRLACDARIHHAVVNGRGHVLNLGTTERLFNRAQRRALAARDKGCRVPGCGMPVAWCEAHHIVPWQAGGPTDVDQGILVCSYHHHEIHAGRLIVESAGPEPGHWRIVPQLRPADRYARTTRTPATAAAQQAELARDSIDAATRGRIDAAVAAAIATPAPISATAATATTPAVPRTSATSKTSSTSATSSIARSMPGEPGTTGALAAEAAPNLAVKLPDRPPTPSVRPPRRGRTSDSVEARLRCLVCSRHRPSQRRPEPRTHPFDLRPTPHIVMRT